MPRDVRTSGSLYVSVVNIICAFAAGTRKRKLNYPGAGGGGRVAGGRARVRGIRAIDIPGATGRSLRITSGGLLTLIMYN